MTFADLPLWLWTAIALTVLALVVTGAIAWSRRLMFSIFDFDDAGLCTECDECSGVAPRQRVSPNVIRLADRAQRRRREIHQTTADLPNGRSAS